MNCPKHPDSDAVAQCVSCGIPVCEICRINFDGRPHCRECIEKGLTVGGPAGYLSNKDQDPYFNVVADRLARVGFKVNPEVLAGNNTLLITKDEIMSGYYVFVILAYLPTIDEASALSFSRTAFEYTKSIMGFMLHEMVMNFIIMSSVSIDENAKMLVSKLRPQFHMGAVEVTMIHDPRSNQLIYYPGRHFYGLAHYEFIHGFMPIFL